jgi:dTDP-glucose 4,6-dehydratase
MRIPYPKEDLELALSLTPGFWSHFGRARLFMTGGTGFVGTWLLEAIQFANDKLGSGIDLVVLSRDPERARKQSPHVFNRPDTVLLAGDVRSNDTTMGKIDLCIHAATDVGNPNKSDNPLKLFDSIGLGTRRVLDIAQSGGARRFLLTSSGAVYGQQPVAMDRIPETYEGAPSLVKPGTAYGNGKRVAEWLTSAYTADASQAGFETSIARIFALIGPGLPLGGSFAAGNFVRDALAERPVRVRGDGKPIRSYLYMADLCVWLFRILESGAAGQAYNVGSENALSVGSLAHRIAQKTDLEVSMDVQMSNAGDLPPPRYVPDTRKARTELGLAEHISLEDALTRTIGWSRLAQGHE